MQTLAVHLGLLGGGEEEATGVAGVAGGEEDQPSGEEHTDQLYFLKPSQ